MSLLNPAGLLLTLAVPVLVVFYLLKVRPVDREVGSSYLWERLLPDLAAHQPWRKPRFPLLFYLQAALLALLVLAASRPAVFALAQAPVSAVYVLDATASMRATDVTPSRFERARTLVRQDLEALPDGSRAAIVLAGATPTLLAASSTDRRSLLRALDAARPTDAAGSFAEALRLADSLVRSDDGRQGEIRAFTDGAFDWPAGAPPLSAPVKWTLVAEGGSNQAITGFGARAAPGDAHRQQVFARVERFGSSEATVTLDLTADGQVVESRTLAFGDSGIAEALFDNLPADARLIQASLPVNDALSADDRASLVLEPPRGAKVLLVTRGNVFLERALALVPGVVVDVTTPRRFEALNADAYDLLVVDGDVPDVLPPKPLLLVSPTSSPILTIEGQQRATSIASWERDHPLMRDVDLTDVKVFRAPRVAAPDWAQVVVAGTDGPLALVGEPDGRRVAVLVPDLRQTNLPLTPAFPILVANAVTYLQPPGFIAATSLAAGDELSLAPSPDAQQISVTSPSGEVRTLQVGSAGPVVYRDTLDAGVYAVAQRSTDKAIGESAFAVNLLSSAESDLRQRELPQTQQVEPAPPRPTAQEGRWALLGLAVFGIVGEWWWYHRRG